MGMFFSTEKNQPEVFTGPETVRLQKMKQIEGSTLALEVIFKYHLEAWATRAEFNRILSSRTLPHIKIGNTT